jgi:hypothetical protein
LAAQAEMVFASQAELDQSWQDSHPQFGSNWSQTQRRAVLEYVRTFTYQPVWSPVKVSGPGVIDGVIVQGTENGAAISPTEVLLNIYQQTDLLETRTATTEADGAFSFKDLPVDEGLFFLAETSYRDIRYTSPSPEGPWHGAQFCAYDWTAKPAIGGRWGIGTCCGSKDGEGSWARELPLDSETNRANRQATSRIAR